MGSDRAGEARINVPSLERSGSGKEVSLRMTAVPVEAIAPVGLVV